MIKARHLKRWVSTDKHVEDDSERPNVDGRSVVRITQQDLWSRVSQRAARGLQLLTRIVLVGEAEIGQLDHAQLLEKNHILRLQVAVYHMQLVAIRYGVHHLTISIQQPMSNHSAISQPI